MCLKTFVATKISSLLVCDAGKIAWPEDEDTVILQIVDNKSPFDIS